MEIKALRDGMKNIEVEGMVVEVGESRTVNLRNGGSAEVMDVTIMDKAGGKVKVPLWDSQIEVGKKKGTKLKIGNGYTGTFRGELQLNIGRYGKLDVVT